MLIKFIINLVEALIVSYSLSRLCHVKKQKLYFVLNTLMTFSIEIISDYFDANYAPLAIAYIICWNILLLFFTRKEYIYNLFNRAQFVSYFVSDFVSDFSDTEKHHTSDL